VVIASQISADRRVGAIIKYKNTEQGSANEDNSSEASRWLVSRTVRPLAAVLCAAMGMNRFSRAHAANHRSFSAGSFPAPWWPVPGTVSPPNGEDSSACRFSTGLERSSKYRPIMESRCRRRRRRDHQETARESPNGCMSQVEKP